MLAFIVSVSFAQENSQLDSFNKQLLEWDRKVKDTANYWLKDVSEPGSGVYSQMILPVIDTVKCYFLLDIANRQIDDTIGHVNAYWYYGLAVRRREKVFKFLYDRNNPVTSEKYVITYYLKQ